MALKTGVERSPPGYRAFSTPLCALDNQDRTWAHLRIENGIPVSSALYWGRETITAEDIAAEEMGMDMALAMTLTLMVRSQVTFI
jgi:hypothetical protein